tara:strand:- start:2090 stop:2431 length:342 start_codon:yes stop_codon:yes gene_type:complete
LTLKPATAVQQGDRPILRGQADKIPGNFANICNIAGQLTSVRLKKACLTREPEAQQSLAWSLRHPPKLQLFFQYASRRSDLFGHLSLDDLPWFDQGFDIPDQSTTDLVSLHGH